VPQKGKFNMTGGNVVGPEFLSLYMALSFYTASFIAEIVRAGIRACRRARRKPPCARHPLRPGDAARHLPQALRIIIPPLTSAVSQPDQELLARGGDRLPDLVAVGGTILNQTGQAIEIIAIWMARSMSRSACSRRCS
jgi:general L-amino acid transport system permease protein